MCNANRWEDVKDATFILVEGLALTLAQLTTIHNITTLTAAGDKRIIMIKDQEGELL